MKVPNEKKKTLTKNQKIIAIIFIVLGGLFVVNEFTKRINQEERWAEEFRKERCSRLLDKDINLYLEDKDCRK